jgi:hypothetical protein
VINCQLGNLRLLPLYTLTHACSVQVALHSEHVWCTAAVETQTLPASAHLGLHLSWALGLSSTMQRLEHMTRVMETAAAAAVTAGCTNASSINRQQQSAPTL